MNQDPIPKTLHELLVAFELAINEGHLILAEFYYEEMKEWLEL